MRAARIKNDCIMKSSCSLQLLQASLAVSFSHDHCVVFTSAGPSVHTDHSGSTEILSLFELEDFVDSDLPSFNCPNISSLIEHDSLLQSPHPAPSSPSQEPGISDDGGRSEGSVAPDTPFAKPPNDAMPGDSLLMEDKSPRRFLCPQCSRPFKRQEHVGRHVHYLHTADKPSKCLTCVKKFARSDNLAQHREACLGRSKKPTIKLAVGGRERGS